MWLVRGDEAPHVCFRGERLPPDQCAESFRLCRRLQLWRASVLHALAVVCDEVQQADGAVSLHARVGLRNLPLAAEAGREVSAGCGCGGTRSAVPARSISVQNFWWIACALSDVRTSRSESAERRACRAR